MFFFVCGEVLSTEGGEEAHLLRFLVASLYNYYWRFST